MTDPTQSTDARTFTQEIDERCGPVSTEEAFEILRRFCHSHFDGRMGDTEREKARISIPADPRRDDDLRMHAFISQSAAIRARLASTEAELVGLRKEVKALCGEARWQGLDPERGVWVPGWLFLRLEPALTSSAALGARVIEEAERRGRDAERAACDARVRAEGARAMLRAVEGRLRHKLADESGPVAAGLRYAAAEVSTMGDDTTVNAVLREALASRGGGA